MKEIKPNQPRPSEELLEKVRGIAYYKFMVSLPYRGEFNKFGVYVQSKDIYERDVSKTIYMAGGKFIPKLIFTDTSRDVPDEFPEEIDPIDLADPNYLEKVLEKGRQRRENYFKKSGFSESETIVNKYEPGDWENKLDLLYKFTVEFQEKYIGKDYP